MGRLRAALFRWRVVLCSAAPVAQRSQEQPDPADKQREDDDQVKRAHPRKLEIDIGDYTKNQCRDRADRQNPADPVAAVVKDDPDTEHEGNKHHAAGHRDATDGKGHHPQSELRAHDDRVQQKIPPGDHHDQPDQE